MKRKIFVHVFDNVIHEYNMQLFFSGTTRIISFKFAKSRQIEITRWSHGWKDYSIKQKIFLDGFKLK